MAKRKKASKVQKRADLRSSAKRSKARKAAKAAKALKRTVAKAKARVQRRVIEGEGLGAPPTETAS
jgi:hypothetical protein